MDAETGAPVDTIGGPRCRYAQWTADERAIILAEASSVVFHDLTNRKEFTIAQQTSDFVVWHPSRKYITVAEEHAVILYDAQTWQRISEFELGKRPFDGAWMNNELLFAGHNSGVSVVKPGTTSFEPLAEAGNAVFAVAASSNGLFAFGHHNVIVVYDGLRHRVDLERHTSTVYVVSFSSDGKFLTGRDNEGTVAVWRTSDWQLLYSFDAEDTEFYSAQFHPHRPLLAVSERDRILVYSIAEAVDAISEHRPVHYATAKIALVGDSGVGKTGLAWYLAHGSFREHPSTHGEQFWLVERLSMTRHDGTICEAVIWDLAGQPDYRLVHSLFIDDADVALIVFDPTNRQEPLKGVEFWLRALGSSNAPRCQTILVGGRVDRGTGTYSSQEVMAFGKRMGVVGGYIGTSAMTGEGVDELLGRITLLIDWENRPPTVTTETFKAIKYHVLSIKEESGATRVLVTPLQLQASLKVRTGTLYNLGDIIAATKHLANHGYVRHLRDSKGQQFILLAPDLLNNLAASIVLEARRNPKGLGALNEHSLLAGAYQFPELTHLEPTEREILLDAAAILFIEHNVCFRETLGNDTFLIFPSLINQNKPPVDDVPTTDGIAYTVSGATDNIYASLVVRLGYTNTFTRTNQWRNHAQYEIGEGELCGFRLNDEREGEIDLILYFGNAATASTKLLFQGFFEKFLLMQDVQVRVFPPVTCPKCGYVQPRIEVMKRQRKGEQALFCIECGKKMKLPAAVLRTADGRVKPGIFDREQRTVQQRTQFEKAITWLKSYLRDGEREVRPPTCFISYAWGDPAHERWVERNLATDLRNAGIHVLLDRWHNPPGASISRYIEQITTADFVIVVGTKRLRRKYQARTADPVVAAELKLINTILMERQSASNRVIPLLLEGEVRTSFPPLMIDSVAVDFRNESAYLERVFDIVLRLYRIPFDDTAMREVRDTIHIGQTKR